MSSRGDPNAIQSSRPVSISHAAKGVPIPPNRTLRVSVEPNDTEPASFHTTLLDGSALAHPECNLEVCWS